MPFDDRVRGRRRLRVAVALSVAVHLLAVIGIGVLWKVPLVKEPARKGEPMMVELQNPEVPSPLGNPAVRAAAPSGPPVPPARPSRQSRGEPPRPSTPAARPATPVAAKPVPSAPAPSKPEPARVARATPVLPESNEGTIPKPAEPIPKAPDETAKPAPEASRPTPEPDHAPKAEEPRVAHGGAASGEGSAAAGSRPSVDIRSALRGGAGGGAVGSSTGRPGGRGGIEGDPIPLDSKDPRYTDFLERVKRAIYANWGFPCVKNSATRECEYKDAQLIVEFGILKTGRLQFVDLRDSSGLSIYDDYAVNAIKLASPFPEVPPSMMISMRQGSTGVAILARFSYTVRTSIENVLR